MIASGLFLLLFTYIDYKAQETDPILITDYILWFDVSRSESPNLYWFILTIQGLMGMVLLALGLSGI